MCSPAGNMFEWIKGIRRISRTQDMHNQDDLAHTKGAVYLGAASDGGLANAVKVGMGMGCHASLRPQVSASRSPDAI